MTTQDLIWNIAVLFGTVYLVHSGWNPWWIVLAVLLLRS